MKFILNFLFLLFVFSKLIFSLSFVHGPRISAMFADSAFFIVEIDEPAAFSFRWGTSPNVYIDSIVQSALDTFFVIIPKNLSISTQYYYSIRVYNSKSVITSPCRPFRTPVNSGQSFRFAVYGDSRGYSQTAPLPPEFITLTEMIDNEDPDFVLFLGDAVYGTEDSNLLRIQWDDWKVATDTLAYSTPIFMLIGNHEANTYNQNYDGAIIYKDEFELPHNSPSSYYDELVYYFVWGNSCFYILDSDIYYNEHVVDIIQRNWLESQLAVTQSLFRFAAQHENAWAPYGQTSGFLGEYVEERDAFWKVLREGNVIMDMAGHIHLYNSDFFGVNYPDTITVVKHLVSAGAGASLVYGYGGDFFHYCLVEVNNNGISVIVIDVDGNIRDQFNLVGIEEENTNNNILYSINNNIIFINSPVDGIFSIIDISGRIVEQKQIFKDEKFSFILDNSGVYFIRFYSKDFKSKDLKIIEKIICVR